MLKISKKTALKLQKMLVVWFAFMMVLTIAGDLMAQSIDTPMQQIGNKVQQLAQALSNNVVNGLAMLIGLGSGLMLMSGNPTAVRFGLIGLMGAIISKLSVSIGQWMMSGIGGGN